MCHIYSFCMNSISKTLLSFSHNLRIKAVEVTSVCVCAHSGTVFGLCFLGGFDINSVEPSRFYYQRVALCDTSFIIVTKV